MLSPHIYMLGSVTSIARSMINKCVLELKAYSCDYGCKSEDRVVDSLTTSQRSISYMKLVLIYRCKPANIVVSSLNTSQKKYELYRTDTYFT